MIGAIGHIFCDDTIQHIYQQKNTGDTEMENELVPARHHTPDEAPESGPHKYKNKIRIGDSGRQFFIPLNWLIITYPAGK
jgi:hypothetical protein